MKNYKIKVNDLEDSEKLKVLDDLVLVGYQKHTKDWVPREIQNCGHFIAYAPPYHIEWDRVEAWGRHKDVPELTHPQLRDLVAQSKNEQCLISGANAKLAWANGENVQISFDKKEWKDIVNNDRLLQFDQPCGFYRVKPRTIKLEIEIPVPLSDEEQMKGQVYYLNDGFPDGYGLMELDPNDTPFTIGAWRTEKEIQQVVAALRGIKG
ncbi:hypothetical protein MN869_15450 [Acinetobacter sp. NIPH1876]|uniref:hypothetical protein n=1 Tax=Acinetobacter sp. NIPH1876 TaxID=2924041 RepID=UPI001FAE01F5|nr:hypothetical protein [Acinetobacter sp. NIPH1876]MCJ0829840.1 hypothetical protein [Acinetobacter sp. NIPH1876]